MYVWMYVWMNGIYAMHIICPWMGCVMGLRAQEEIAKKLEAKGMQTSLALVCTMKLIFACMHARYAVAMGF